MRAMGAPVTRNLTILLTDIKGFTDKTSHKTRFAIQEMLDRHRGIVLPILESRQGKLIKTIGDAFLMVFESPTDAVLAGVAVQEALKAYNEGKAEADRIEVRIAINLGEVNLTDNDIFGEPVNITARIEAVTEAGEVFFTEAVYLSMNKNEVPSSEVGLLQLKGIPEKIRVYKVRREVPVGGAPAAAPNAKRHIWDLLARRTPVSAASAASIAGGSAPSIARRAAAVLIDFALVTTLTSIFCDSRVESVQVLERSTKDGRGKVRVSLPEGWMPSELSFMKEPLAIQDGNQVVRVDGKSVEVGPSGDSPASAGGWRLRRLPVRRSRAMPAAWLLYGMAFVAWWAATPGKRIMKLAVVQQNGSPVGWTHAFARALFSLVSCGFLAVGYLWAFFEKDRRGWHDLLAGTKVVDAAP